MASGLLFLALAINILLNWEEADRRLEALPATIRIVFAVLWGASTFLRFYLSRGGLAHVRSIATDRKRLGGFARWQVVASLVSTLFAVCASLYASGALDPVVQLAAARYHSFDLTTLRTLFAIGATLFWGILTNALWDFIKLVGRRIASGHTRGAA